MSFQFLENIALASARRYRAVFVVTLLLAAVAGMLTTRIHLDTDILNLLPKEDPKITHFLEAMERFGGTDYLLVVVRVPEGEVPEPYGLLVERLGSRLERLDEIERLDYTIGAPEELIEEVYPQSMLFLDDEARATLERRLEPEGIRQRARELRRSLTTPQSVALKELIKLDPFGLAEIFLDRMQATRGELAVDWTSGYYLSKDHRLLLLLARPILPPQDTEFDVRLVDAVQAEVDATLAEWDEISGADLEGGPLPAPEIALGGSYLTALDDYNLIRGDMVRNILTSTALVLVLFLLAFHRLGPLLYATLPLAGGLILTFGFSAVTVGSLSSATSGTAALLIGLGIDFVIVSYGRYVEERRRGKPMEPALAVMARTSGRAVVVGAVTTAATFFAFLVTDFTGLRQMGLLTGTGILFCMIAVLVLLPALISWGEHRHLRRDTRPNLYLHSFGTGPLMRGSTDHPWAALAIGLALTAVAVWGALGLEFEEGMESMRPEKGNRGIEVGAEVAEHFDSGFDAMMLMVRGDTLDEVFERSERAVEGAQRLADDEVILGYSGLTSLIPPPQRQRRALEWLERGRESGLLDPERIVEDFREALAEEGMRVEPFRRGLELFEQALRVDEPLSIDGFGERVQTGQLLERYLQRVPPPADGDEVVDEWVRGGDRTDGWVSVVYLYPPHNKWRREPPPQAVELAEELGPDVVLTGPNVVNQRMRERVRRDAVVAAVLGFLLVAVLLWIDFGRLRDALLSLTPLLVGILWMLGGMAALDLKMNFMNVFVTTMIIGIGVDYGIHAVHRYRESGGNGDPDRLHGGLAETGKAIVVAALSTVVGFGSLATSRYPGLRSTGYVAILGALGTALVAITLLPAFLSLLERRRERERNG
ncbi:MAG: MMPL family transporter [Acidobacteriota bacterium]|jgi:predicted RND superfamily exporter protein